MVTVSAMHLSFQGRLLQDVLNKSLRTNKTK